MTHAAIEAAAQLRREHGFAAGEVSDCVIGVEPHLHKVCAIAWPADALQGKFSLRFCTALALAGEDTSRSECYAEEIAARPALRALGDRIRVVNDETQPESAARVELRLRDGRELAASFDVGEPCRDLALQGERLRAKFHAVTCATVPAARRSGLVEMLGRIDTLAELGTLMALCRASNAPSGESPQSRGETG